MQDLGKEFEDAGWDVEYDVPFKYNSVFEYKIPLVIKQEHLVYNILEVPIGREDLRKVISDIAKKFEYHEVIVLALLHPEQVSYMPAWLMSRIATTPKGVWEIIVKDSKRNEYEKEIAKMQIEIREVERKIDSLKIRMDE